MFVFASYKLWQFEVWDSMYGQIGNVLAFRIWDAQFEILRFETMKIDRSSQERRAAVVPRINWLSAADQPRVNLLSFSSIRFTYHFVCSCFRRVVQDSCLRCPGDSGGLEGKGNDCLLGEPTRRRPCPAWPRSASPPAVRRPARTRPWYVRV